MIHRVHVPLFHLLPSQVEGKPGLLTCLFPNDTGASSPRLSNSHIMTADGGYVDVGACVCVSRASVLLCVW